MSEISIFQVTESQNCNRLIAFEMVYELTDHINSAVSFADLHEQATLSKRILF